MSAPEQTPARTRTMKNQALGLLQSRSRKEDRLMHHILAESPNLDKIEEYYFNRGLKDKSGHVHLRCNAQILQRLETLKLLHAQFFRAELVFISPMLLAVIYNKIDVANFLLSKGVPWFMDMSGEGLLFEPNSDDGVARGEFAGHWKGAGCTPSTNPKSYTECSSRDFFFSKLTPEMLDLVVKMDSREKYLAPEAKQLYWYYSRKALIWSIENLRPEYVKVYGERCKQTAPPSHHLDTYHGVGRVPYESYELSVFDKVNDSTLGDFLNSALLKANGNMMHPELLEILSILGLPAKYFDIRNAAAAEAEATDKTIAELKAHAGKGNTFRSTKLPLFCGKINFYRELYHRYMWSRSNAPQLEKAVAKAYEEIISLGKSDTPDAKALEQALTITGKLDTLFKDIVDDDLRRERLSDMEQPTWPKQPRSAYKQSLVEVAYLARPGKSSSASSSAYAPSYSGSTSAYSGYSGRSYSAYSGPPAYRGYSGESHRSYGAYSGGGAPVKSYSKHREARLNRLFNGSSRGTRKSKVNRRRNTRKA